jgi:predicted amidohydrolase
LAPLDLFAVQAYVSGDTYVSAVAFERAMRRLVERCQAARAPGAPAIAVFPEHIGTFLALALLGRIGPRLRSAEAAAALAAAARPIAFARALGRTGIRRIKAAALLAVAGEVREIYERVFSSLAREHRIAVVGGSALLTDGGDEIYNLSLTFDEDGRVAGRARKVNLVPEIEDRIGLARGEVGELRPAAVAAGRVGTLVCYDGFTVAHTAREPGWRLAGEAYLRGPEIVAQPAANPWPWQGPWVHRPPGSDLSRQEQWAAEGLESLLPRLEGVSYAVTAHLVGEVLGQRFEGRSAIYRRAEDGTATALARALRADLSPESEEVVHARVDAPWLS